MAKETLRSLLRPYGVEALRLYPTADRPDFMFSQLNAKQKAPCLHGMVPFAYAQQLNGGRPRAGESLGALRPQTPEAGEGFPCTPIPR